jgi:hypothetical protein
MDDAKRRVILFVLFLSTSLAIFFAFLTLTASISWPNRSPRLKRIEGLRAMILMLSPFAEVLATPSAAPLVLGGQFLMMTTLTDKVVYLLFVLCYSLCIFDWLIKRHPDI